MRLVDVNVLVYAFREDAPGHAAHRAWVETMVSGDEAYAVSAHVLAGFLRIVTHPRVFHPPTPLAAALEFVEAFRNRPNAVPVAPGERHWEIFLRLC
ncbi:MAG: PIN domain-containing protein, partial [Gemmatimonadota bacterium]|nr:PIN domain-containing protein [Gemmatimonadota bacterium]